MPNMNALLMDRNQAFKERQKQLDLDRAAAAERDKAEAAARAFETALVTLATVLPDIKKRLEDAANRGETHLVLSVTLLAQAEALETWGKGVQLAIALRGPVRLGSLDVGTEVFFGWGSQRDEIAMRWRVTGSVVPDGLVEL